MLLASTPRASYATHFAWYFDDDALTIAIDSRIADTTASGTTYQDNACKHRPISHNAIFFAEGVAGNNDKRSAQFDVFVEAYRAFGKGGSIELIASRWAETILPMFKDLYRIHHELLQNRHDGETING